MTRRPPFRPRSAPPELLFIAAVALLAAWLYSLATAPRHAVTASVAPACADAPQPCRRVR